jgi:uncharacterized membrane protein YukC
MPSKKLSKAVKEKAKEKGSMQFILRFKIVSWKNVALGIGIVLALYALAGLVFYLTFIFPTELQIEQIQREMEEHERRLIEQGIFIPTPSP